MEVERQDDRADDRGGIQLYKPSARTGGDETSTSGRRPHPPQKHHQRPHHQYGTRMNEMELSQRPQEFIIAEGKPPMRNQRVSSSKNIIEDGDDSEMVRVRRSDSYQRASGDSQ